MNEISIRPRQGLLICCLTLVLAGQAAAHIKNEGSQFPDIEFSEARFDIVLLVGAGVIPETPVFEPDQPLTKADLAAWAALAKGLGEGGETPDTRKLANAAREARLIDSLEGEATYDDINNVLFEGQLTPDQPGAVPAKGGAASFIAANLTIPLENGSLLEQLGLEPGPTGAVTEVESRTDPDQGSAYYLTIGGETHQMYAHGRVANGPTDLLQWQDRTVRQTFLRGADEHGAHDHGGAGGAVWAYLEAEPIRAAAAETVTAAARAAQQDAAPAVETDNNLLYGLIAAVLVLGVLLFFRRKRT